MLYVVGVDLYRLLVVVVVTGRLWLRVLVGCDGCRFWLLWLVFVVAVDWLVVADAVPGCSTCTACLCGCWCDRLW